MKKRYIIIGITCIMLLISGICYSCSYKSEKSNNELITKLSGDAREDKEVELIHNTKESTENMLSSAKASDNAIATLPPEASTEEALVNEGNSQVIYVHLCGEVVKPGVYEVAEGFRVIDLIELAGGLTKEAAGDYINQALRVKDGQRIYIPSMEEIKELPVMMDMLVDEGIQEEDQSSTVKRININLADSKELMELPGVGEAKAASIIEYRTANGSFQTIEELMKIPGIKEGLFNKIASHITVK